MKVVDLSQTIFSGMKIYPGDPPAKIEPIHFLRQHGWRLRHLSFGSHTGTHVDVPVHMDAQGKTLDQLSLENFFGPARLVQNNAPFPAKIGLFFAAGLFDNQTAKKIIEARAPFIGLSVDCDFPVAIERKLLKSKIITFTDLINVNQLPKNKQFLFYGFPLKIKDGDGSPIRAVAVIE